MTYSTSCMRQKTSKKQNFTCRLNILGFFLCMVQIYNIEIFTNIFFLFYRVRRLDLLIEPGQSLGLMIRGGAEYGLGIFVTGVDKDSVADRSGLTVSKLN